MTDWRALCEELADTLERAQRALRFEGGCSDTTDNKRRALIARARKALAAEPVAAHAGPTDEELWQVGDEDFRANTWPTDAIRYARAVLARWGHQPAPVPVTERLPGPEDCDAEGRCWLFSKVEEEWRLIDAGNPGVPHLKYCFSHWLPATALPLPSGEVQP